MCNSYESRSVSARAESYKKGEKTDLKNNFFTSPCFLGIRDPGSEMGKNPDPGSGINIPDPQHCIKLTFFISGKGLVKLTMSVRKIDKFREKLTRLNILIKRIFCSDINLIFSAFSDGRVQSLNPVLNSGGFSQQR